MKYPLEKYRFFFNGNRVIAVSSYAGKVVRGIAICHPDDEFDLETGKRIAAMRCNEKIAAKRLARAAKKKAEATAALDAAMAKVAKEQEYYQDAFKAYNEAAIEFDTFIRDLTK